MTLLLLLLLTFAAIIFFCCHYLLLLSLFSFAVILAQISLLFPAFTNLGHLTEIIQELNRSNQRHNII
jgi:hypothetical protein